MKSTKKKRILRAAICLTCAVTIASVNTSVYAEPSTNELEGKTSDLQGELKDLNSQLSTLSDELDATSSKIEELSASVEKSKLDVAAAKLNEDAQYDAMKDRIKFMYEGGSASLLEILFSSENMADFLNKAEFVSNISTYDRQMLDELQAVRADIEKKQETLETQQEELAGLQSDLESKQEALNPNTALSWNGQKPRLPHLKLLRIIPLPAPHQRRAKILTMVIKTTILTAATEELSTMEAPLMPM